MRRLALLLALTLVGSCWLSAQGLPTQGLQAQSASYIGLLMDVVHNLIQSKNGLFLHVAWQEWYLFSSLRIFFFLLTAPLKNRGYFDWEGFIVVLGYILAAAVILIDYSFLSQIPFYAATGLAQMVGSAAMDPLMSKINGIASGAEFPSNPFNVLQIAYYLYTTGNMGLIGAVLFALNSYVFVGIGWLVVIGSLTVPCLVTKHFTKYFFRWVDSMIALPLMIVTIALFAFMFGGFLMKAFDTLFGTDLSLARFGATFAVSLMLTAGFVVGAIKINSLHNGVFSGMDSFGATMSSAFEQTIRGAYRTVTR